MSDELKQDAAEPAPASDGSVSEQLVERLRGGWPYRGMDARILCEEAAAEIERLRLTESEREAIAIAESWLPPQCSQSGKFLRGLLKRTK